MEKKAPRTLEDILETAKKYADEAQRNGKAHYRYSDFSKDRHYLLGILVVPFATIASSFLLFSAFCTNESLQILQIIGAIFALIAAIISGLQTFFQYLQVSEIHRFAGAKNIYIYRELELFILKYKSLGNYSSVGEMIDELSKITNKFNHLGIENPEIPSKFKLHID